MVGNFLDFFEFVPRTLTDLQSCYCFWFDLPLETCVTTELWGRKRRGKRKRLMAVEREDTQVGKEGSYWGRDFDFYGTQGRRKRTIQGLKAEPTVMISADLFKIQYFFNDNSTFNNVVAVAFAMQDRD